MKRSSKREPTVMCGHRRGLRIGMALAIEHSSPIRAISSSSNRSSESPFETQVFGRYARVEKTLVNAIAESYLQGVSTRLVETIISHFGIDQISPSLVSQIAQNLDREVQESLTRTIEQPFPHLFLDASYYTVRDGPGDVSKALLVMAGVREGRYCEILGATIVDLENEAFWSGFFDI